MAVLTLAELVELQRLRAAANKNRSGNIHAYGAYSTAWYKHGGASLCIRIVLLVFATACTGAAQRVVRSAPRSDAAEVGAALLAFLGAFENLEWDTFRASFLDDACVFFPSARTPERFCGKDAVQERFRRVFDEERRGAASGPPYLRLRPEALDIRAIDANAAIVTFHLRNDERVGRRTIVFRKTDGAWRIAHLHASNVPWPDEVR